MSVARFHGPKAAVSKPGRKPWLSSLRHADLRSVPLSQTSSHQSCEREIPVV